MISEPIRISRLKLSAGPDDDGHRPGRRQLWPGLVAGCRSASSGSTGEQHDGQHRQDARRNASHEARNQPHQHQTEHAATLAFRLRLARQ